MNIECPSMLENRQKCLIRNFKPKILFVSIKYNLNFCAKNGQIIHAVSNVKNPIGLFGSKIKIYFLHVLQVVKCYVVVGQVLLVIQFLFTKLLEASQLKAAKNQDGGGYIDP